ncbi:MAG: S41 family peptidase [Candidatus Obscuribacterales bacterium]
MGERMSPRQVYDKAWNLIKDSFYLQTFSTPPAQPQNWNRWRHRYDGKLETEEDAYKAIQTMLLSLGDPQTEFMGHDAFGEEKSLIQAHLFGVGVELGQNKQNKVVVTGLSPEGPAERAGIRLGDELVDVGGIPVRGRSVDEISKQIHGERGTKAILGIVRGADKRTAVLTRAAVSFKAVTNVAMLNLGRDSQKIAYIRLASLSAHGSVDDMRKALTQVKSEGAAGIVLDLRDNSGGLLAAAVTIADLFVDDGVLLLTVDSDGYKTAQVANPKLPKVTLPMVVLINNKTAGVSEMLAGCLRDHHRAILIGEKTKGTGLVTAINPLGDGSGINVSIATMLTPSGAEFNKVGVMPDLPVVLKGEDYKTGKGPWWSDVASGTPDAGKDVQLSKAVEAF